MQTIVSAVAVVVVGVLVLAADVTQARDYGEKRLAQHLIGQAGSHGSAGRPLVDASLPLNVTFSLSFRHLVNYDVRGQLLTTDVTYFLQWRDEQLTWEPALYDGVTSLTLPADLLYTPDVEPLNARPSRILHRVDVQVSSSGLVTWTPPAELETPCPIARRRGITKVRCTLEFGSWTQTSDRLRLVEPPWGTDRTDYKDNRDWRLHKVHTNKGRRRAPGGGQRYDVISFELSMERW